MTVCRRQKARNRRKRQKAVCKRHDAEGWRQKDGYRRQEAEGEKKLEVGSRKQRAG